MKTIRELRSGFNFNPEDLNIWLKFFAKCRVDFDVFLPSKKMNLQRDFVWTLEQKQELIWSMLLGREIPRASVINVLREGIEYYEVIDGKQRLSSMIDFLNNKFHLNIEGVDYYFNNLPKDYQLTISNYPIEFRVVNEPYDNPVTDEEKIDWFMFINFAGTPQDSEHFNLLKNN